MAGLVRAAAAGENLFSLKVSVPKLRDFIVPLAYSERDRFRSPLCESSRIFRVDEIDPFFSFPFFSLRASRVSITRICTNLAGDGGEN